MQLSVLVLAAIAGVALSACGSGWTQSGNKCFKLISAPNTWSSLNIACTYEGGRLASIASAAENDAVKRIAAGREIYIGGLSYQRGPWSWADNTPFGAYRNWASGSEPAPTAARPCIKMNPSGVFNVYTFASTEEISEAVAEIRRFPFENNYTNTYHQLSFNVCKDNNSTSCKLLRRWKQRIMNPNRDNEKGPRKYAWNAFDAIETALAMFVYQFYRKEYLGTVLDAQMIRMAHKVHSSFLGIGNEARDELETYMCATTAFTILRDVLRDKFEKIDELELPEVFRC